MKTNLISYPVVDPGLYTLTHSQEFLSLAFLTRDLPALLKWRNRMVYYSIWYKRLFIYWRNKQYFETPSAARLERALSLRFPH